MNQPFVRCFLVLILCFFLNQSGVSSPDTLFTGAINQQVYLRDNALILETSHKVPYAEAKRTTGWKPVPQQYTTRADRAYWLHVILKNTTDSTEHLYLYTSLNQNVAAYLESNNTVDIKYAGTLAATPDWASEEGDTFIPVPLRSGQTLSLYIRIANAQSWLPVRAGVGWPRPYLTLLLEREQYHYLHTYDVVRQNLPELTYRTWIQGALAFWLIFVGLIYARYRQSLYKYYFFYVLGAFVFALLKTRMYTPLGYWVSYFPMLRTYLPEVALWGAMAAYFFFISDLLQLSVHHSKANQWLHRFAWFFVAYAILYGCVMLLTNDGDFHRYSYRAVRFVGVALNLGAIFWIALRVKSPLTRYVVLGYAAMAGVSVLAWMRGSELILKGTTLPGSVDNLFTVSFGVLLEILAFALALAHRIKLIDRDRQASQQAYIEMLEKKSSYERQLAETEMQALRSQLNPHFLFNSLNSLEYFILTKDNQKASHYLTRFSKLLRKVLTHSRARTITLHDELDVLRLYLEIEKNRFGDEFSYCMEVSPGIDQESIVIPPLLLQPFVENAIWHGLLPSPLPDKSLKIRIGLLENILLIEIEDNGIGRKKSAEQKKTQLRVHQSFGMEIIQQRIALFNQTYESKMEVEIVDIENGSSTGTLVRILYHLNYGEDLPAA